MKTTTKSPGSTAMRLIVYTTLGAVVLAVDRLTKAFVAENITGPVDVISGVSLVFVKNRGISLGLFNAQNTTIFVGTSFLVAIVGCLLAWHTYLRWVRAESVVGEVLVLAGAFSNMVDRCVYAGVIDFIELSLCGYSWPAFNVADSAIVAGVSVMLIRYWRNP